MNEQTIKDIDRAFKALEERNELLDKIRAEIEQDAFKDVNGSKYIFVNRANQIIDKYRESEEIMEYKALTFETIFDLKDFLNSHEIQPQSIVSILRQSSSNGYGRIELLYLIESED